MKKEQQQQPNFIGIANLIAHDKQRRVVATHCLQYSTKTQIDYFFFFIKKKSCDVSKKKNFFHVFSASRTVFALSFRRDTEEEKNYHFMLLNLNEKDG